MPQPSNELNSETWRPCKPGELAGLGRACSKPGRNRLAAGTLALVLIVVLAIALFPFFLDRAEQQPAALGCQEVKQLLRQHAAGQLARPVAGQVEEHLRHCEPCRQAYENQRQANS